MRLFGKRDASALPARAVQFHRKAMKLLEADRLEEALINFERVVDLAPNALEPRANLGAIYYRLAMNRPQGPLPGWLEESARHFRHVLGIDPDQPAAALGLAAALDGLGRHAEALAELEKLARSHPAHPDVQYNLAIALARAGRVDEARAAVERELSHRPDHAAAAELLAQLTRETRR